MAAPRSRPALAAFAHRDFRVFWLAALASNTGSWMQNAALPYVAFALTGRYGGVGATGFWQYLPVMLMGAAGGSIADRFDRRRVLIVTQVAQATFAVALWALVASGTATAGRLSALAFASGLAGGLNIPVWQAFVGQLVPREALLNAVTLNSAQFNAARALGTFAAGLIIAVSGPSVVFAVNAVSFGCVLVALALIPGRGRPSARASRGAARDLLDGVRYVRSVPAIVSCCIAIIAIAGLASPLFSFVTATYADRVFVIGGWQRGLLWAAGGIGAVAVSPALLTIGARIPRDRLLLGAMLSHAAGTAVVGLAPRWWVAAFGLMLYGGSYLVMATAMNTTIQLVALEEMRGRTYAVYVMCLTGALPIGLLVWGWAADRWAIRPVTVTAGALLALVVVGFHLSGRLQAMARADASAARAFTE